MEVQACRYSQLYTPLVGCQAMTIRTGDGQGIKFKVFGDLTKINVLCLTKVAFRVFDSRHQLLVCVQLRVLVSTFHMYCMLQVHHKVSRLKDDTSPVFVSVELR